MNRKKLVVVGGGAAGHKIAHDLSAIMEVTLIDPKTYWEVPMALPRLLVQPDELPARMTFKSFLPDARHVQGYATRIANNSVIVETSNGSETIPFDYAVISTGSRYIDPLIKAEKATELERIAEIEVAHQRLKAARRIVVIGGGPVGVEITAELRETFPKIPVTLVHAADRLLENAPDKFPEWAKKDLESKGVTIILKDLVVEPKLGEQPVDGKIKLKSGRVLDADTVVWAAGAKPLTDFVKTSWPELVEANGLIKTDSYLRLEQHPNIFVAGDVTNLPEGRLAITASFHVVSIVENLKALASKSFAKDTKLKPYAPKVPGKGLGKLMILTLGRNDGLSSLPFGQLRFSFIARNMKSQNMFVGKYRKDLGLNPTKT
ncbi:NAD(P)/FAD-dependent oxidoreductase [Methyloradius palustris]|uniref:NADH dehydrogenase n=1 Tax=Methyloradius palustris TaxID=2778876 RepID=A0A8D5K020_9PROT|nr:FAD-dependent oxidoreductase [Methyloradius palustris]BCM24313.1 NADH dehydrogenase [Methyloradius palustris]